MLRRLLLLFFAFVSFSFGFSQTPTTQGTNFWVSFMRNGYRSDNSSNDQLTLIVSAKHSCVVTVNSPFTQWSQSAQIDNGITTIIIPDNVGYNSQQAGIADKGLYVSATDTISLFIANDTHNSYDAANVLPIETLGCKYMVQSNKSIDYPSQSHADDNRASFLVIATEDDTQVQITPSCETHDNHPQGVAYTITLQTGQCYHVLNKNPGSANNAEGDFSGTLIESLNNKPIAVFNGNCVTSVAEGSVNEGYDHVFEQAMPVDNWGRRFVVTKTKGPNNLQNDRVKVTALFDNTEVLCDGIQLCPPLAAGQSYAFWMTQNCCYLESNGPVAVYLYNHSHSSSNSFGDPSMVWISPVEQTIQEVIFSTFSSMTGSLTHYVNVVCYTDDMENLRLNGRPVSQEYIEGEVPGAPQFSFARVLLTTPGKNSLSCPSGLVAHVYGLGERQGYAYTVGSSAKILTKQLYVNDILSTELLDGYYACQSETVRFRIETNYEPDLVVWDFGDGTPTVQGAEVSHTYAIDGDFLAKVVEEYVVNGTQQSDSMEVVIHVNPQVEVWKTDSTCNSVYVYDGITFPVPFFGDSIVHNDSGCESIYHMNIMEGSSHSFVEYDTACLEYLWLDTLRYASGTYIVVMGVPGGCDSLCILHLTIGKPPENPVRYKTSCSSYYWDDRIVCDTSGTYRLSFTTEDYCDYDSVLYFTRLFEPPFEEILGQSNVAVSTSYWPGKYVYSLDDSTGMNHDDIHWKLLDDPGWEMEIKGFSCVIRTGVMGSATLHVWTTDNELCYKEAFKSINCSGFNVGENGITSIEIYPNPARDEVIIKGEDLESVVLYDVTGRRIRAVPAYHEEIVTVHVNDLSPGLYLVEIQSSKYNITRLVSVMK